MLSTRTRDRVLQKLGFTDPPTVSNEGLRTLYRAWCASVPFDNLRKMIAFRVGDHRPFPGGDAEDFFAHWLSNGVGGTCWPTSNALFELLQSLGFQARRIAGCMRDLGLVNHGSVKVELAGRTWLVDTSLLHETPVPLGAEVVVQDDPVFGLEVEPAGDDAHLVWVQTPPNTAHMPCRLFHVEATHAFFLTSYEASRQRSPFNQRLYARRNRPGELIVLVGNMRFSKTVAGVASRELTRDELRGALHHDIGASTALIEQWAGCGGLEASFEPPSGPTPPPLTGKPPSQRDRRGL